MAIIYENINYDQVNWAELNSYADRTIFQTVEWLDFLRMTQKATPVIAAIKSNNTTVGYFTGLVFKKFGIKLLGSPFKGWTTSYMGFNLNEGVSKREVLRLLPSYVFDVLGCHYLEMVDQNLKDSDFVGLPYKVSKFTIQEVDLTKSEKELFASMQGNCRRNIRRSQQLGLTVEEADPVGFAEEYYGQLVEVFAKQNLTPTHTVERVKELIEKIYNGGLLLLRQRTITEIDIHRSVRRI
jgi:hypothetical protein